MGMTYAQALQVIRELSAKPSRTQHDDLMFRQAMSVLSRGMFFR